MPKKKITREKIIEKAYHIFLSKGYHHTSMSDIANECNIFKSGLYHYFPDKESMACEVLQNYYNYAKENLLKHLSSKKLTPKKKLQIFFDELIQENSIFSGSLFGLLGCETSDNSDSITLLTKNYYNLMVSSFENMWLADLSPLEARKRAQLNISMIEGAMLLSRVNKDPSYLIEAASFISADAI